MPMKNDSYGGALPRAPCPSVSPAPEPRTCEMRSGHPRAHRAGALLWKNREYLAAISTPPYSWPPPRTAMISCVRFYFPIWVRIMVPNRFGPGRLAFDCSLLMAPWIYFREWLARRAYLAREAPRV